MNLLLSSSSPPFSPPFSSPSQISSSSSSPPSPSPCSSLSSLLPPSSSPSPSPRAIIDAELDLDLQLSHTQAIQLSPDSDFLTSPTTIISAFPMPFQLPPPMITTQLQQPQPVAVRRGEEYSVTINRISSAPPPVTVKSPFVIPHSASSTMLESQQQIQRSKVSTFTQTQPQLNTSPLPSPLPSASSSYASPFSRLSRPRPSALLVNATSSSSSSLSADLSLDGTRSDLASTASARTDNSAFSPRLSTVSSSGSTAPLVTPTTNSAQSSASSTPVSVASPTASPAPSSAASSALSSTRSSITFSEAVALTTAINNSSGRQSNATTNVSLGMTDDSSLMFSLELGDEKLINDDDEKEEEKGEPNLQLSRRSVFSEGESMNVSPDVSEGENDEDDQEVAHVLSQICDADLTKPFSHSPFRHSSRCESSHAILGATPCISPSISTSLSRPTSRSNSINPSTNSGSRSRCNSSALQLPPTSAVNPASSSILGTSVRSGSVHPAPIHYLSACSSVAAALSSSGALRVHFNPPQLHGNHSHQPSINAATSCSPNESEDEQESPSPKANSFSTARFMGSLQGLLPESKSASSRATPFLTSNANVSASLPPHSTSISSRASASVTVHDHLGSGPTSSTSPLSFLPPRPDTPSSQPVRIPSPVPRPTSRPSSRNGSTHPIQSSHLVQTSSSSSSNSQLPHRNSSNGLGLGMGSGVGMGLGLVSGIRSDSNTTTSNTFKPIASNVIDADWENEYAAYYTIVPSSRTSGSSSTTSSILNSTSSSNPLLSGRRSASSLRSSDSIMSHQQAQPISSQATSTMMIDATKPTTEIRDGRRNSGEKSKQLMEREKENLTSLSSMVFELEL